MAVVNRNYMDLGDYPSKPVSNKPLYTKPYVNNLVSSAVIGATAGTSSATNSSSGASGAGSGSSGYTVPSAESSYASALQDYYDKMEAQLRRQEREAEKKMKAQVEQGVNTLESQKPALGQQFQDSAQQAYIQHPLRKIGCRGTLTGVDVLEDHRGLKTLHHDALGRAYRHLDLRKELFVVLPDA